MTVSSHDFEEEETKADLSPGQDWGVFQVSNSLDLTVVGNEYIDTFLTAGLGCHRVHHLLPRQGSGFANIACKPLVKKLWEDMGYKWAPTPNFVLDRVPAIFRFYLCSPIRG